MSGVLVDLAEHGATVVVRIGGPSGDLSGRLVGVGRDFLVLEEPSCATLIALHAIDAVVAEPSASPRVLEPSGDERSPTVALDFAGAVAALAADRLPVRLRLAGGQTLAGELTGVGSDVIWLRASPPKRALVYVPLGAVLACSPR